MANAIELSTSEDRSTTLEAKLAITLEVTFDLKTRLNGTHHQLATLETQSQPKISALMESHAHHLEVVHTSYAAKAIEYEDREAKLLLLHAEVELTTQNHVGELASHQSIIEHLCVQLADEIIGVLEIHG